MVVLGWLFLSPGYIRPDSVAIYSYLRSSFLDRDLLFLNEWHMVGLIKGGVTQFKEVTALGTLANHWWIGTSMIAAPFYVVAALVEWARGHALDGFSGLFAAVLAWVSVAATTVTLLVGNSLTRDSPRRDRIIAAAVILTGTPLFWYTFRFPLGTHASGAFVVALLTWQMFKLHDDHEPSREWLIGLLAGLAVATRLQHVVLLPAIALAVFHAQRSVPALTRTAVATLLGVLPQLAAWFVIYGNPLGPLVSGANLTGVTWMPFQTNALLATLFSSYHGLFAWAPVTVFAIAGWLLRFRHSRFEPSILLLMFAGEWIANGLLDRYFWGGMSFGPRRFVDLAVPFLIGVVWFLRYVRLAVAVPLLTVTTGFSILLGVAAAGGSLPLERYVSGIDLFLAARAGLSGASLLSVELRSPLVSTSLALNSLIAIVIILGVVIITLSVVRTRKAAVTVLGLAFFCATLSALAMLGRTRAGARDELTRLRISAASSNVGPLLDQEKLLLDEIAYLEATGKSERAARTRAEVRLIDEAIGRAFAVR